MQWRRINVTERANGSWKVHPRTVSQYTATLRRFKEIKARAATR